jgi:hypothetical protein
MISFNRQLGSPNQVHVITENVLESFAGQHQIQLRSVIHSLENWDELFISQIQQIHDYRSSYMRRESCISFV